MALDAGSVWIIGVPCVAIATKVLGLPIEGIFLASFVEEVLKIAVGLPRFLSGKWINNLTTIGKKEARA
jgi:Na+-driven multidrug efflux pump